MPSLFTVLDLACACVSHGRDGSCADRDCWTCDGDGVTAGDCAVCGERFGLDASLAHDDTERGYAVADCGGVAQLCSEACAAAWWASSLELASALPLTAAASEALS